MGRKSRRGGQYLSNVGYSNGYTTPNTTEYLRGTDVGMANPTPFGATRTMEGGGAWYNPFSWFSKDASGSETPPVDGSVPVAPVDGSMPVAPVDGSVPVDGTAPVAPVDGTAPAAGGGRFRRRSRRGGFRWRSKQGGRRSRRSRRSRR